MPLFEYHCASCEEDFEEIRRASDDDADLSCPGCGGREVKRKLSTFAVFGGALGTGSFGSGTSSCGSGSSGFG